MTTTLRALIAAGVVIASFGLAVAKLPPPDDAAKAAAEAKKTKDAAAAEVAKSELARAEDRAVANYMSNKGKSGGEAATAMHTKSKKK